MRYLAVTIISLFSPLLTAGVMDNDCEHDHSKKIFYTPEEMVTKKNVIVVLERMKKFYTNGSEYREEPINALQMAQDKRVIEAYEYKLQVIDGVNRGHKINHDIYQYYCKLLNMKAKQDGS